MKRGVRVHGGEWADGNRGDAPAGERPHFPGVAEGGWGRRAEAAFHRCPSSLVCAFTLIEVLVVIVVIGVLIAALALVGGKVLRGQKVNQTLATMRSVRLAIDQFATENPLGSIYGRVDPVSGQKGTFGPFPPYQLRPPSVHTLPQVIEPATERPGTLAQRLTWDLSGNRQGSANSSWVLVNQSQQQRHNDDIRALYTYLRVYSPETLSQVPAAALARLRDKQADKPAGEFVNPSGGGTTAGTAGLLDVFGIHDAWDVPLDYFLYVKLEWTLPRTGGSGVWRVVERVPVLRSRGIKREVYDVWVEQLRSDPNAVPLDSNATWILSDPLPAPPARQNDGTFWQSGGLAGGATNQNGWARAIGEGDLVTDVSRDDPRAFGYVP